MQRLGLFLSLGLSLTLNLMACQSPPAPVPSQQSNALSLSLTQGSPDLDVTPASSDSAVSDSSSNQSPSATQASAVPLREVEWQITGSARDRITGHNANFSGYFTLTSQNRILDPQRGLTYQVGSEPWLDTAGRPVEGPENLAEQWSIKVYALNATGERYGFPVAQTRYAGDFEKIHWNGVADTGHFAPHGRYEIVAVPEGFSQKPLASPLQLLNSAPPEDKTVPTPDYATDYLLARFHDPQQAAQSYTILSTNTAGVSQVKASDSPQAEVRSEALLKLAQQLQNDPNVKFAEPDLFYQLRWTPNDPRLNEQYALQKVQAEAAWDEETGSPEVIIAIVDTGIDPQHPDLASQLVPGWNTINNTNQIKDDHGHGTHCAGIAAAAGDNQIGIAGLAPHAKIMPVKVMDASGRGSSLAIAEGIRWASDHGAQVISLSLGTTMGSTVIRDALVYAVDHGASIVAAMGNDGGQVRSYPAVYASEIDGVIAVGATDANDGRAYFSNYGQWITVTAPGQGILSTLPRYRVQLNPNRLDYGSLNGTSMATPYVAGLAGLLKSQQLQRSPADIQAAIIQGADDLGSQGFDAQFGHGRINAARSLGLNLPVASPTPPVPTASPTPSAQPTSAPHSGSPGLPGGLILDID